MDKADVIITCSFELYLRAGNCTCRSIERDKTWFLPGDIDERWELASWRNPRRYLGNYPVGLRNSRLRSSFGRSCRSDSFFYANQT